MIKKIVKFKFLLIFILVFILGIIFERFDFDNKISIRFNTITDKIYQAIYSFRTKEKIYIFIEPRHYQKILNIRELVIEKGMLTKDLEDWVPARLSFKDNSENIKIKVWLDKFLRNSPEGDNKNKLLEVIKDWIPEKIISKNNAPNIKIRLKGVWPEHWKDDKQWSFKIKFIQEKNQILDLSRVALQPPSTLDYIYEWLLSKGLENEKLINLPVSFSEIIINNKSRGVYTIQGQISDELLIKNKRPVGPIVGFAKDTWIKEQINSKKLESLGAIDSLNGIEDTFWRSKIEPVRFSKFRGNIEQERYLEKSIFLLESFRDGTMKPSEIFDIVKLAKVMALRALLGSSEFDYLDTKFYFNPSTSLLEPITKEAHVILSLNWRNIYYSWWIDSSKIRDHYTNNTNFFVNLLYKDKIFYAEYLKQLKIYSSTNFYEKIIKNNQKQFNNNIKLLKNNYPTKKIFSLEHLKTTRIRVNDVLSPVEGLNAYFENFSDGVVRLAIHNIQRLPIEVIGIELDNGQKILIQEPIFIYGKKPLKPTVSKQIELKCKEIFDCNKKSIERQKIIYRILGQKNEKTVMILPFYHIKN
jgi:hypothetical protein